MKRTLLNLLKLAVSITIIVALVVWTRRQDPHTFDRIMNQPKQWDQLLLAWLCCLGGVLISFVRWFYLVRAVDLPFRIQDALRLGFLGYFFNFFSLGSVGGDLFKAVFVAREHPERRAEAVATVVIDRIIGLYGLLVLATLTILATNLHNSPIPQLRTLAWFIFLFTSMGLASIMMLIVPGFTTGALSRFLSRLPKVGSTIGKLIGAIRTYQRRWSVLLLAGLFSLGVHSCLAVGIYLIARGLPGAAPGLGSHFLIVPLSMLTGALPLPVSGLGAFEAAMEFLYLELPTTDVVVASGQGLSVSLAFRLITIAIALVGACYYISARREMAAMMRAAQSRDARLPDAKDLPDAAPADKSGAGVYDPLSQ